MVEVPVSRRRIQQEALRLFMDASKWDKHGDGSLMRELSNGTRIQIVRNNGGYQPIVLHVSGEYDYCTDEFLPSLATPEEAMEYAWICFASKHLLDIVSREPPGPAKIEIHPR